MGNNMNTEDSEFERIAEEAKRRAAREEDDDIQEYKKPWVGLTDEEIKALASWWPSYDQMPALMVLAKDIQNSLKEKNT